MCNDLQDLKFPRFFTRQKCDPDVLGNHEYVARSKCVMRSIRSCHGGSVRPGRPAAPCTLRGRGGRKTSGVDARLYCAYDVF